MDTAGENSTRMNAVYTRFLTKTEGKTKEKPKEVISLKIQPICDNIFRDNGRGLDI